MRNNALKGLMRKSPLEKNEDIDTTWADQVFSPSKVNESLRNKGYHTQGELRGKKDTTPTTGNNTGLGNQMINPGV